MTNFFPNSTNLVRVAKKFGARRKMRVATRFSGLHMGGGLHVCICARSTATALYQCLEC